MKGLTFVESVLGSRKQLVQHGCWTEGGRGETWGRGREREEEEEKGRGEEAFIVVGGGGGVPWQ